MSSVKSFMVASSYFVMESCMVFHPATDGESEDVLTEGVRALTTSKVCCIRTHLRIPFLTLSLRVADYGHSP